MTAVVVAAALLFGGVDGEPWRTNLVVDATTPAVRTTPRTAPAHARCGEWWLLAEEVGWPTDQLPTLDYVMHRESRCNPHATGILVRGKRALGLMQLLGWSCPPDGCYDPRSNLTKALELWRGSGWRPWCLRGDPVTGSC